MRGTEGKLCIECFQTAAALQYSWGSRCACEGCVHHEGLRTDAILWDSKRSQALEDLKNECQSIACPHCTWTSRYMDVSQRVIMVRENPVVFESWEEGGVLHSSGEAFGAHLLRRHASTADVLTAWHMVRETGQALLQQSGKEFQSRPVAIESLDEVAPEYRLTQAQVAALHASMEDGAFHAAAAYHKPENWKKYWTHGEEAFLPLEHPLHAAFASDDWAALVLAGYAANFPGPAALQREDLLLAALRVVKLETLVERLEANGICLGRCDDGD